MRILPLQTRSSVAVVLAFVFTTFAHSIASAGEAAGHSPFGALEREGFPAANHLGTAEREALYARPQEATTDTSDEQPSMPADVVFAGPALPASQEVVAAPAIMAPSPPLGASQFDAVVFGPPSAEADPRLVGPASTSPSKTGVRSIPAPSAEETTRLKARARELLADGSVASARALLEDAASGGNAESEYLLAQTYDLQALTHSGVIGVAGDAGKAEAFYRAAQIGGYRRPDYNARAAQP